MFTVFSLFLIKKHLKFKYEHISKISDHAHSWLEATPTFSCQKSERHLAPILRKSEVRQTFWRMGIFSKPLSALIFIRIDLKSRIAG
jgi:hypothetical protein